MFSSWLAQFRRNESPESYICFALVLADVLLFLQKSFRVARLQSEAGTKDLFLSYEIYYEKCSKILGPDVMQIRFGVICFYFGPANFRNLAGEFLSEFWWRILIANFSALFFQGFMPPKNPKGPRIEKIQSRLKFSILTFSIPHKNRGLVGGSLEIFNLAWKLRDLDFFQSLGRHAQNSRPELSALLSNFTFLNPKFIHGDFLLTGETKNS